MIEIEGLVKRFGSFTAVDGISFKVEKGEVLGFLGPNGAGKSTTMRMITGFLAPTDGRAEICGIDVAADSNQAQTKMGYLPEGAPAYGEMTPRQFLSFICDARGLSGADAQSALTLAVERTQLEGVLDQTIDTLSKGFKRRVGLAQAILHDPPVLIMDEPTDGLDPNQKHAVRELIRTMAAEKAIIISTHILEEVEAICSRAVIIDQGRIVADGTPEELAARSRYHNAVTMDVGASDVDIARSAFNEAPGISEVAETRGPSGSTRFTLFPSDPSRLLIEDMSVLAVENNWNVKSLYAEEGRLDEVFRSLTTSDAAPDRQVRDASLGLKGEVADTLPTSDGGLSE